MKRRKVGITVLPPDVNESLVDFTSVKDSGIGQIRFGLAAIKGVGENAVHSILEARDTDGKFTDVFEFAGRVDPRHANRRVFEALVKCGALDSLEGNRAQQLDAIDVALDLPRPTRASASSAKFRYSVNLRGLKRSFRSCAILRRLQRSRCLVGSARRSECFSRGIRSRTSPKPWRAVVP